MGWGRARGKPAYGTAVGIFTSPDVVREGYIEAGLRHCGRNLYVSRWGAGRLGGKPAYGTAVGFFYVSGWGGGGLGGSQPTALR